MFTEFIRKGKWSYMFLAAVATLAVAALATFANTSTSGETERNAKLSNGQVKTERPTQYNEATMRFIN